MSSGQGNPPPPPQEGASQEQPGGPGGRPPEPAAQGPASMQPSGSGPPPATSTGPSGPRAGFGLRLVAWLVDVIILAVVGGLLGALFNRGVGNLLSTLIGLAYYVYLEGSPSGQTVGKKLMSIRVIDMKTGGRVDYGHAVIRYFAKILSAIPCGLGYFWMLWDKEKQTWHDKLSTTVVVPTSSYPVSEWPG